MEDLKSKIAVLEGGSPEPEEVVTEEPVSEETTEEVIEEPVVEEPVSEETEEVMKKL